MNHTECPYCGVEMHWSERPQLRQTVSCYACKGSSQVISLNPIELDELVLDYSDAIPQGKQKRFRSGRDRYMEYTEDDESDRVNPFRRYKGSRSSRRKSRSSQRNFSNW